MKINICSNIYRRWYRLEDLINRLYELKDLELLDKVDIEKIIDNIKKTED